MVKGFVILLAGAILPGSVLADTLTTREGKAWEGSLTCAAGDLLRIAVDGGETVEVPLSEVGSARKLASAGGATKPWVIPGTGVLSVNGSFIARPVRSIDATKVTFEPDTDQLLLTTANTAAVFFHPLAPADVPLLRFERRGVLLRNGDFMEGQIVSCGEGILAIQSVLFGRRSFAVGKEVAVAFLRAPVLGDAPWAIQVADGSRFQVKDLQVEEDGLVLGGSPFHQFRIAADAGFEIRREKARPILEQFEARWEALRKGGPGGLKEGLVPPVQVDDAELRVLMTALARAEAVQATGANKVNSARQEWQRKQQIWVQKNQQANRAKSDTSRTRSQAKSKAQQAAGLERSVMQAKRDLDEKTKRIDAAREAVKKARGELGRIVDNEIAKRNAEAKVRNAERSVQNAERVAGQAKANHARFLGRWKSAVKASQAAAGVADEVAEKESKTRREWEEATRERDAAKQIHDRALAAMKELSGQISRLRAKVDQRREALKAAGGSR